MSNFPCTVPYPSFIELSVCLLVWLLLLFITLQDAYEKKIIQLYVEITLIEDSLLRAGTLLLQINNTGCMLKAYKKHIISLLIE
jgi:hypothetical protein